MATVSVSGTASVIYSELQGFRTVQVFNGGPGGLWISVDPSPNGTVNASTGVPINPNTTAYVDVHRAYLYGFSNDTSAVQYT